MPGDKGKETACYDIECDKKGPNALTIKVMAYNNKNKILFLRKNKILFLPQAQGCA